MTDIRALAVRELGFTRGARSHIPEDEHIKLAAAVVSLLDDISTLSTEIVELKRQLAEMDRCADFYCGGGSIDEYNEIRALAEKGRARFHASRSSNKGKE